MAQTNYTPISLYYSATASATPSAGNLVAGELAINTNDGKLFYKDSSGVVQVLATKATGTISGSTGYVQFNNAGALGSNANFFWDNTNSRLGIGTASPANKLQIVSADNTQATIVGSVYSNNGTAALTLGFDRINGTNSTPASASLDLGVSSYPQAVRIDSNGNLLVGATSTTLTNGGILSFPGSGANSYLGIGHSSSGTSGSYYEAFNFNGTAIGTITQNGTTGVLYNLTSDYRLKDNPQPLIGASEFIMALQPKTWDWWDGSGKGVGFIAHEFMEVAKYSGNGEKDAVDVEGKPVYQSIQPSSSEVMANLVALVQEQQALIESLTTRLTALEAK